MLHVGVCVARVRKISGRKTNTKIIRDYICEARSLRKPCKITDAVRPPLIRQKCDSSASAVPAASKKHMATIHRE
eukprot:9492517-Pyramimonas_sp.AAC.1